MFASPQPNAISFLYSEDFWTVLAEMALPGKEGVETGAQLPHKYVRKKMISRQTLGHFRILDF